MIGVVCVHAERREKPSGGCDTDRWQCYTGNEPVV
jgi:hypothetical protein